MNRKSLLDQELNKFLASAKKELHPKKIILFGSAASGRIGETSDLDLVLVADSAQGFWERNRGISRLCSDKVGMDVLFYTPKEFLQLTNTRKFFRDEVVGKGKVVYEQP